MGETVVNIMLGDLTMKQKFVVVGNLTVDCLLGADFLQAHSAILDCCNHTLSFGTVSRSSIPISCGQHVILPQPPDALNCILRAFTDIEIAGRTIQMLRGKVDPMHSNGSTVLIELTLPLPDNLHMARSIGLVEDGQVAIQVMNTSPSPVRVFKGMRLGMVTPESNIFLVSQQEMSTKNPPCGADNAVAPLFHTIATPDLSSAERSQLLELLTDFHDIFAPPSGPQGCTSAVKHAISVTGPPIRQPMRRVPEALKDSINCEVNRMLEQNII